MTLHTKSIFKTYKQGDSTITAVKNVTVNIAEGKFTAITGTSGCGKTTLLSILGGLIFPTTGEVLIDNNNYYKLSSEQQAKIRRDKFGFVFQNYSLIPIMTALENISVPSLLNKTKPDMDYIKELCTQLRIDQRLNHLPSEMSGGEQQRTALARALSHRPEILFADEPTGNLDHDSAETLITMLRNLQKRYGFTIVMVTHDDRIATAADMHLNMESGAIIN